MKYICLLLLALVPQTVLAQEASLAWFTDAEIANSTHSAKPADALPDDEGTVGNGVLLTHTVGVDGSILRQMQGMISFWIKPNWDGNDGSNHKILSFGDPASNGLLIEKSAQGALRFVMSASGKIAAARLLVDDWQAGKWHHIAASWKESNGSPLGLALWIDKVCVDSCLFIGDEFIDPIAMPDCNVYIGDASSDAVMDELILRRTLYTTTPFCPGQLELVYRDYFQTAPYTDIKINHEANLVRSDTRVVMGCNKQFGLKALMEGKWVDITNFEVRGYWNWSNFDAKPFINWSTSDPNIATVDWSGRATGHALGNCTLTATFRGMTDDYDISVISADQPDLDLMFVERLPRYSKYDTKKWPDEGETVSSVANIGNFGFQDVPAGTVVKFERIADVNKNFVLDDDEQPFDVKTAVIEQSLAPRETTTVSFSWDWTMEPVFIRVTLDPDNALDEICEANNQRCEINIARSFHWGYDTAKFDNDYYYKNLNLVGSFSDYDWCNAETDRMALVMRESIYPTTSPIGIRDSIRVDNFQKRLYGNWDDEPWVIEGRYYDGGFPDMEPQNSTVMDIDPAIGHEIGHTTLGLPDLYGHPHQVSNVLLKDENGNFFGGTRVYPSVSGDLGMFTSGTFHYTDHLGLGYTPLMVACHLWVHPANAGLTNHYAQTRRGLADMDQEFGLLIPQGENSIQVFDVHDQPLSGAVVYVYQMINTGLPNTTSVKYVPDRPKFIGKSDATGVFTLPQTTDIAWDDWMTDNNDGAVFVANPFSRSGSERAWGPSWAVGEYFILKIVSGSETEFRFLTLTDFNEAYLSGKTLNATYPIRTNLRPCGSVTPIVRPTIPDAIKVTNLAPIINLPDEITATAGGELVIDASASYDPEGQPLFFRWFSPVYSTEPVLRTTAPSQVGIHEYWLLLIDGVRWSYRTVRVKVVSDNPVSGQVTDANGNPMAGAVVGIKKSPFATADADYYTTTDGDGNYGPIYIEPGAYYIAAWKEGFAPGQDVLTSVEINIPTTRNLKITKLAGKNILLGSQLVSASNWESEYYAPAKATDGDLTTAWQTKYWPDDPQFFYIDLGQPTDISGITLFRYYEMNDWGGCCDDYAIDVIASGDPLDPYSWEGGASVQRVYSAARTFHGYPIRDDLAADPIGIELNNVRGIRLTFVNNYWPDVYEIREIQVHSKTEYDGLISGRVMDSSGAPIRDAVVQLGGKGSSRVVVTDDIGVWSFAVTPGAYEVYADALGYAGKVLDLDAPGDGTPCIYDFKLSDKDEPGQYNGDFELAVTGNAYKADGWEIFIDDGGANPSMYSIGRSTAHNTTPGGAACGCIEVGTGNQQLPYWYPGWMRPTAAHLIPVSPDKSYNFYFKARKTGYAVGFWTFTWIDADGNDISQATSPGWYWVPRDDWMLEIQGDYDGGKKPMIRMDPPIGAVWAEVRIGFTDWPSDDAGRGGTTFVDDLIVDEFGLTFMQLDKLADAKIMTNGELISIEGKCVTAAPGAGISANMVYVEEPDRSCGICVDLSACSGWTPEIGDILSVRGELTNTTDGECCIQAFTFDYTASGQPLEPVLMNNRGTAGATFGSQAGVWEWRWVRKPDGTYEYKFLESVGLNPIGLLVKVYGKVTQIDPSGGYFYIDDGARADDGTTTGDKHNYGIRIALDGRDYTEGRFLQITGIVSCFKHTDGKLRRLLRPITIE